MKGEDVMNETIKNLIERRSCRKYSTTQIKEEELNSVLKAEQQGYGKTISNYISISK